MGKYRVALLGLGYRGIIHGQAFLENADRFELAALCDMNEVRLDEGGQKLGIENLYTDAEEMLSEVKPDVFCFVTQPAVRLSLVKLGVKYGVKAMAFEKPMSTSAKEAREIKSLCVSNGIKTVVSHQGKYMTSLVKLKEIVDSGEIGEIVKIHATTLPWMLQLGTHFTDYSLWLNGGAKAKWVVGHVHGRGKLFDSHPSPDFIMGEALLENGVRFLLECGYLSPSYKEEDRFWVDNRLNVYGTHGYAWADNDGGWWVCGKSGQVQKGQGECWELQEHHRMQIPYIRQLADWLDDDSKVHPSNLEIAYHGYEILQGMALSALDNRRVDLPLNENDFDDVLERMRAELPEG